MGIATATRVQTTASQELLDMIDEQIARVETRLETIPTDDSQQRCVYSGWRDCFRFVREQLEHELPHVEAQALNNWQGEPQDWRLTADDMTPTEAELRAAWGDR